MDEEVKSALYIAFVSQQSYLLLVDLAIALSDIYEDVSL
jgi:hypothetical protein